jgi:hypothetical protein
MRVRLLCAIKDCGYWNIFYVQSKIVDIHEGEGYWLEIYYLQLKIVVIHEVEGYSKKKASKKNSGNIN